VSKNGVTLKTVEGRYKRRRSLNVIENHTVRQIAYEILFVFYCNYGHILYRLRDKATHMSKISIFTARRVCIARTMPWQNVCLSVCSSVRLSVRYTTVFCLNDYTYPQSFFSPSGSSTILVFPHQTGWQYSHEDAPNVASDSSVYEKKHDFQPIYRFITQTMQDRTIATNYYGKRIGNHTQAFEWYQFEWYWVTSNPDFKVTILFNVKQLRNCTR